MADANQRLLRIGPAEIAAPIRPEDEALVNPDAMAFLAELTRRCRPAVEALVQRRHERRQVADAGWLLDFDPETSDVRSDDWTVAEIPPDLQRRQVEITAPAARRKMVVNALNAAVDGFMADFEDALSPTWANLMAGQGNLRDAVNGRIVHEDPDGRRYRLQNPTPPVLHVRPRGWHQLDKHVAIDGRPVPGTALDVALFLFHNARTLVNQGSGPYLYLSKLQDRHEAALWADMLAAAEEALALPAGTVKVTLIVEHVAAAFQIDEMLHALRHRAVAVNAGRWGYLASYCKLFTAHRDRILPDRETLGMDSPFLEAYARHLVATAHRRGALAIGGMTPYIPIHNDEPAHERALESVCADKRWEGEHGYDGTWVVHPALAVPVRHTFAGAEPGSDGEDAATLEQSALLAHPAGEITEAGLRDNVSIGIQYLEAWIGGTGCVPLYNRMEDASTAEVAWAQVRQWLVNEARITADDRVIDESLFIEILDEEMENIRAEVGDERFESGRYAQARDIVYNLCAAQKRAEFLTDLAYDYLL